MQNFWWNRKFYHGKEEPDSFRLHRLEEGQTAAVAAVESLSKAQTALEQLLTAHGSLLSEHTGLLSDLTAIAEGMQEDLQAVSVECDNIGSELLMLENNDAALSARVDGIEEACADTAAEQATRIDALEQTTADLSAHADSVTEKVTAMEAETAKIADLETASAAQNSQLTTLQTDYGVGAVFFTGDGAGAVLSGNYPASMVTLYDADGTATPLMIGGDEEKSLTLPAGNGVLYGVADTLEMKEGSLSRVDLRGMTCLKTLRMRYCSCSFLLLSALPHLDEVVVQGVSGGTIDLRNQTNLAALTLVDCYCTVKLPTKPKNLCFVQLSMDMATEEFLDSLLPDRTGQPEGWISLSGADAPSWLAERNWMVM